MKKMIVCLLATALLGGCGISEDLYNAKVAELNKTKADLDQNRANAEAFQKAAAEKQAQLDKENQELKDRLVALGQDMSKMTTNLDEAKKRMDEMKRAQEQAEKRAAQFRMMVAKFKSMIDAGKLQVEIRDGLMLVKLPDNILFDPGRTDLKPAGKDALKQVAQILASIEGRKFQVAGHTDNTPIHSKRFKSNWELSTQRAVEVVKFMAESGMDAKRLSAAGYADTLPVADNSTEQGRAQNRRIEIVVVPNIEDLPPMEDLNAPKS
ncbi:MAG: OmpA family protein [Polyangia bacterium]|jgi:chemotaxis protein MotB